MSTWREIESRGSSKTKHAEVRAKLAADIEAFLENGGKIKTEEIVAHDENKTLVDEFYLRRLSKLSASQLKQMLCNIDVYGVRAPKIVSYVTYGRKKIAMFHKSDVARFVRELKEARSEAAA